MKQSNQKQPTYFPRLNINVLKIHAARWAARWPDVPIDRIVLYNYASEFQMYYDGPIKYKKYAVVFEISEEDKLYGLSAEERFKYDWAVVHGEITPEPYYYFIQDLEHGTSVIQENKIYWVDYTSCSIICKLFSEENLDKVALV